MFYKNYSVGYIPTQEKIGILKYNQDMSNFKETETDKSGDHIIQVITIDTYKYEHYQNYLDENGLFMGIFPPEFIETDIKDYYDFIEEEEQKRKQYLIESSKKPIDEKTFKFRKEMGDSLNTILEFIEKQNRANLYCYFFF